MQTLDVIKFQGDRVFLTEKDGEPYIPVKPICENIGLSWQPQHEKLSRSKRWKAELITVMTEGGPQQMLCIPLIKLPAWLASISPEKVKPELRDKLIKYQEESDMALWNYWRNKNRWRFPGPPATVSEIEEWNKKLELRRKVQEEVADNFARLALQIEKSGINLSTAVLIAKGRKAGFNREQVARALEIDPETVSKIESVCRRTGFWNCFGYMQNDQTA